MFKFEHFNFSSSFFLLLLPPHIPCQPCSQLVPQIASCQIKAEQNNLKPRASPACPALPSILYGLAMLLLSFTRYQLVNMTGHTGTGDSTTNISPLTSFTSIRYTSPRFCKEGNYIFMLLLHHLFHSFTC